MKLRTYSRAMFAFAALGLAACSQGGSVASPGATSPGTPPGGGTGGGGGGTGGGSATCPAGTTNAGAIGANTVCNLTGEILNNLTLPNVAGVVYRINGRVDVGRDLGADGAAANGVSATLTIAPGARLFGDVAGDILIVNRGSRISAIGTASQPIVFTSREDVEGTVTATATRQWGGVILLGRAPVRACATAVTQGTVECQNAVEGVTAATGRQALFGGATPTDNSGAMRYVRISYSSDFLTSASAGDDLNGLTLGGVGSGTDLSFIQIHNSGDDGIEWFGGNVSARNIVVSGALDDSLDYDDGWTGNVQFAVVRQGLTGSGGPDRVIEGSNRTAASSGGTLNTNPTFSNFTFVGLRQNDAGGNIQGITLNNTGGTPGSSGRFLNGVVTGSNVCAVTDTANTNPAPRFDSILFDCPTALAASAAALVAAGANNSTAIGNSLTNLMPGPAELARTAVNPTTVNSFFTAANYIGAFSPTESATANWATGWTIGLFAAPTGCPAGTTDTNSTVAGQRNCRLSGVIGAGGVPANVRLVAGNIYQLSGRVDVGVDRGADLNAAGGVAGTLTIDAGVTVYGNSAADVLIVNRGSQIFVNGTANAPVVMTSLPDVLNTQANADRATREWAGLIVLGRAPVRACATAVAGGTVECQNAVEGITAATGRQALFGGATANDNSGRINNLQIRYPGAFLTSAAAGDDLNGLTLGGVGSGTQISNIQIHNSGDDGIEIFGGTVNLRNWIVTGALDDSFDLDDGWVGRAQFGIILQALTGSGGPDRLIESSNRVAAAPVGPLNTNPIVSNFTFVGIRQNDAGGNIQGIVLNNTGGTPGSSGRYLNGVVTGSNVCVVTDTANPNPAPRFDSLLLDCPTALGTSAAALVAAGANNTTGTTNTLTNRFVNGTAESARTAIDPTTVDPFFTAATYIGAVRNAADTWWRGWSCGLEAGSNC
jgi:trimeric autotransporter adhesin